MPTQAVGHTCSGNLGIVKILQIVKKNNFGRKIGPLANCDLCLSTPKHNGKSGTGSCVGALTLGSIVKNFDWEYLMMAIPETCRVLNWHLRFQC